MMCAWQAYLNLLPHWMREDVDKQGRESLQELHIRIGQRPELILARTSVFLPRLATKEDLSFVINTASQYSPWAAGTVGQGYLTATGGHRIGICGIGTVNDGKVSNITVPTSLCIRVARDFYNIANGAVNLEESILIIGPPGSGKTTLLRDLIRGKSNTGSGNISVVDEREELFPMHKGQSCFEPGCRTDVLSGCPKEAGINSLLRCMNPAWIAVDEITAKEDCEALLHAGWCGVKLLATAHAGTIRDLITRPVYRPLIEYKLFQTVLVLHSDKSWTMERMKV